MTSGNKIIRYAGLLGILAIAGLLISANGAETPAADKAAVPAQTAETAPPSVTMDYERARWDPIHFKPGIDSASNADCLNCHQEILEHKVRDESPAGLKTGSTMAWYQTLDTYEGEQMTFHQRHLTAPFINRVANMQCTTCHQGNDLRDENSGSHFGAPQGLTLRKMVNPDTCLMCHGQFNYTVMALPGPWSEHGKLFQNNCLLCHANIRTRRHEVNFLKPAAIEAAARDNPNTCYGCHGGRSWYRISFPYPRHPWPGAADTVPDWAKDRPTASDLRFLIQGSAPIGRGETASASTVQQ
ncbi:MAG TPA: hypothetical protein PLB10_08885 [Thiolinea sp.]|nr:hypothetical protein [Thiolinea sp.]